LGAVERLDLALVDRDDHHVLGRVHVEADDVLDLLDELRIVGALERANAVRLQPMRLPQALHGALTPTALDMARPVQCVAWLGGSEQVRSITLATTLAESGARPGLRVVAQQAVDALLSVSRLSAPDRGSADVRSPRHSLHRQAIGRTKDDVRPPHMFERAIAIRDDGQQTLTVFGGRKDTDGWSHAHRLAHPPELGIIRLCQCAKQIPFG
jgi:hypothetical protein